MYSYCFLHGLSRLLSKYERIVGRVNRSIFLTETCVCLPTGVFATYRWNSVSLFGRYGLGVDLSIERTRGGTVYGKSSSQRVYGDSNGYIVELDGSDGINRPLIYGSPSTPDPDYFKWVDRVLEIAGEKGLYVGLLPTWGDKVDKQWGAGPEIFDEANAREYGRWLGRRYADTPNIIWIIGGDRSGEGKNFTVWKAMAEGIKECDKRHLMTYHPQGEHSSSFWFHDETWLDFNMFQSGHAQRDYAIYRRLLLNDLQKQPIKPVLDGEPRYENIPIDFKSENGRFDDFDVRMTLYQSMFSGACGYTYGCNEVWQMYSDKYSPMIDAQTTWKESLDLAGACDMIHFRKLCEAIDFSEEDHCNI